MAKVVDSCSPIFGCAATFGKHSGEQSQHLVQDEMQEERRCMCSDLCVCV